MPIDQTLKGCMPLDKTLSDEERIQLFMEVVDCERWEVMDVPANCSTGAPERGEPGSAEAQLIIKSDEFEMPFGKHKGLKMKDVPTGYLQWMLEAGFTKNMLNLVQEQLRKRA